MKRVFVEYFPEEVFTQWECYDAAGNRTRQEAPNPFQHVEHERRRDKVYVGGRVYTQTSGGYKLSKNRYPLDEGEFEVPVKGRTGPQVADSTAHLRQDGSIRIDCMNNPTFYAELRLPKEYVLQLAERIKMASK